MKGFKQPKVRKINNWKKYAHAVHLWLGLISGVIVFIIAITGCIFVFQDEIKDVVYSWRFVEPMDQNFVLPATLFQTVRTTYPDAKPTMVVYQGKNRPAHIAIEINTIPHEVYINPYKGRIIHTSNLNTEFFNIVERLHRFLLFPYRIGKQITGIATLIFILMLISGLVLWWPKKWKNARQNFRIKWKAKWKRRNYDLHRTVGFYLITPALLIAITGLAFTYEWVHDGLFVVGNLTDQQTEFTAPKKFPSINKTTNQALNQAFVQTRKLAPDNKMLFVWDQGEGKPILTGTYPTALDFDHQSNFYFHPADGSLVASQYYNQKVNGTQLQEMNYGLHTGQYLGVFGKIMAFFASLFVASLPITGGLLWWRKQKKNRHKSKKNSLYELS